MSSSIAIVSEYNLFSPLNLDEVIDYLNKPQNFLTFSESIRNVLEKENPEARSLWDRDIINIIFSKFSKAGVQYHPDTVRHWIKRDVRPGRELAVALCFVFEQFKGDPDAADIFLMRDCILDGFSPREPSDIIYRHCIANSHSWEKAVRMQNEYAKKTENIIPCEQSEGLVEETTVLINEFFIDTPDFYTDADLIDKLVDYYETGRFGRYRKTALEHYEDSVAALVVGLDESFVEDDGKTLSIPYSRLLDLLFPRPRAGKEGDPIKRKELMLPKEIVSRLPNEPDLPKIEKGQLPVSRKVLILAYFACFWICVDDPTHTVQHNLDLFRKKMNSILSQCGMLELYPGNPFDWMIMKSVLNERPMEYLDDLIDMAYELAKNEIAH
jgi:hypothetical protein